MSGSCLKCGREVVMQGDQGRKSRRNICRCSVKGHKFREIHEIIGRPMTMKELKTWLRHIVETVEPMDWPHVKYVLDKIEGR